LSERIQKGEIDPSFVITHRFANKQDNCLKAVLKP
jgi:hypothetical protein